MIVPARLARSFLTALPIVAALVCTALLAVAVTRELRVQRAAELTEARHQARTLAVALTEHVQRAFEQADVVAKLLAERVMDHSPDVKLPELAREGTLPMDLFVQIGITDERGVLRASTVDNFKPIDLSDRAHIRVHLADPAHGPYISKPLLGRASGKWSLQYSRAILAGNGRLLGVVVISLDPTYFSNFHQRIDLGEHGTISLIGTEDRVVRTQRAGTVFSAGHELAADDDLFRALRNARNGAYEHADAQGALQLVGYDSLSKYPLVLSVGLDGEEFLAHTRRQRDQLAIGASLIGLAFMLAGIAGSATLARQALWVRRTQRAHLRATQQADQLDATVTAMPVGVLIVDQRQRIVRCNAAFLALTGLDESHVRQAYLQALLDRWCEARQFEPRVVAAQLCAPKANAADQRVMMLRAQPPEQRIEIRAHAFASGEGHVLVVRDLTHGHAADTDQTLLIAAAAHELRGPIARIEGFADLLSTSTAPPSKRIEITELLRLQSHQLRRVFDDLIDVTEIELNGDRKFHYEDFDLRDLAALVADACAAHGGPKIETTLASEPVPVHGDRVQLGKAVQRLVEQAAKLAAAGTPIHLDIAIDAQSRANVMVSEHSAGLAPVDAASMQRLLRNAPAGPTGQGGMSLSLVVAIIDLHDGQVFHHGAPGGSAARIELPLAAPAATAEPGST